MKLKVTFSYPYDTNIAEFDTSFIKETKSYIHISVKDRYTGEYTDMRRIARAFIKSMEITL